jgi:S-adenosylmethionine decarboxylase
MQGLHLTADLRGCRADDPHLSDVTALRTLCLKAVTAAGLTPVGELFHSFASITPHGQPAGATGVVLLAESHLAVHTWPEIGGVTLDAYVCNLSQDNSAKAEALVATLIDAFAPLRVQRQMLQRGAVSAINTVSAAVLPAPAAQP